MAGHNAQPDNSGESMKYMLMIFGSEGQEQAYGKEAETRMMAAYGAYTEAMQKAGVMKAGDRLKPSTSATTVRAGNGKTEVLNGPYAERAARRLLHHRCAGSGRRHFVGGAMPRCRPRHDRSPSHLVDVN
jgi:hypothetical protein